MKLIFFIWSFVERFGTNIVSLVGNIILSYILLREDFGLIGMLSVFTSLIFVFVDCGLSDGLLMHEKPTNRDFNTVFYFNMATSLCICLIFIAISPLVANYFQQKEVKPIMIALGIGAIFSGSCISQATKLRSQLQFRKIACFNVFSVALALIVAIIMALKGLHYWALVELQIGYSVFYLCLLIAFSSWNLKLEFDIQRFKQLWRFGVNLLFSTIMTQVSQNIFTFVLGKFYSPLQAGYMWQAQKLQQAPTNSLEMSISSTSYVLIAKERSDNEKTESFIKMFKVFTFVLPFFLILACAVGKPLIAILFPSKWEPCTPYFQTLLAWGVIYTTNSYMMILFKIFDLTKVIRNTFIVEKTGIVILAFALYSFGVYAIMAAAISMSAITFSIYLWQAKKQVGLQPSILLKAYFSNVIPLALIGGIAILASQFFCHSWISLAIGSTCFLSLSLLFMRFFRKEYFTYLTSKLHSIHLGKSANP